MDSELWLRSGDLLFQRGNTREYVGIAAYYTGEPGVFLYPDLIIKVRPSEMVNLRYLHLGANAPHAREYFSKHATGSQATMPKINHAILRMLPVPESGEASSADRGVHASTGGRHGDFGEAAFGGSVITNAMLRRAMHEIAAAKGDFTFFAKILRSDAPGTWDLVVSAPWLGKGQLKATTELVGLLSDAIGEDALHDFARIATVGKDHPTVKFLLSNLPVEDGELRVASTDLFGLQIDEAVIFRAWRPGGDRNGRSKALHPAAAASGRDRG